MTTKELEAALQEGFEATVKVTEKECKCPEGYHDMFENCRGY